jgi:hypothetical protein
MKRMNGGSTVKGGYYWNLKTWEVTPVQGEVGNLPGGADDKFVAVPLPALFVVIPLMGAAYAFALPAIGFGMAIWGAGKKLGLVGKEAMDQMAATVTPAWRPGESYFAGKPEGDKVGDKAQDPSIEKLQKEIEEKRQIDSEKKN